jgi:hypothetical protein
MVSQFYSISRDIVHGSHGKSRRALITLLKSYFNRRVRRARGVFIFKLSADSALSAVKGFWYSYLSTQSVYNSENAKIRPRH